MYKAVADSVDGEHSPEGRRVLLLGNPDTKRTNYLMQAARQVGLQIFLFRWGEEWNSRSELEALFRLEEPMDSGRLEESLVKIDPPLWDSCIIEELDVLTDRYRNQLLLLESCRESCRLQFFNDPREILALLDKRACKTALAGAGLSVTEMADGGRRLEDAKQLLSVMEAGHIRQVFIKPVIGSGAAGIAAFRFQPRTGQMALYTCAMAEPGSKRLVNTKRLRRFSDRETILSLLNRLLRLDCIVERWYVKAEQEGFSYDLRAVMQDGRLDFLLARLSKGPITNLHLNNHPLPAEELRLPQAVTEDIADLCRKAMACYPGLRSAGIDILLEKGSLRPRIIEMNGQGDLIYQDIYHENRIYLHQAKLMKAWKQQHIRLL